MQGWTSDKQNTNTQSNKELKPLFVGKIENEKDKAYRDIFPTLMGSLSAKFKEKELRPLLEGAYAKDSTPFKGLSVEDIINNIDNIQDNDINNFINRIINNQTSCICNYDFYVNTKEYTPPSLDHPYNGMLLSPSKWVKEMEGEDLRSSCIEIVNYALNLAGYGEYLNNTENEKKLTEQHDICCSVNYYYDRNGNFGFHQDSYGRELFVLLIYLDPVHGPEVKLKTSKEFEARMNYISKKHLMPTCFIDNVKELYNHSNGSVVQWDGGSIELKEDLAEWIKDVAGPGGIVGFVDELMIHSTPYIGHRKPNGNLLLGILEDMKDMKKKTLPAKDLAAIKFLKTTIQDIPQKDSQLISIYQLQDIIQNKLQGIIYHKNETTGKSICDLYFEESDGSLLQEEGPLVGQILNDIEDTKKGSTSEQELAAIEFLAITTQEIIQIYGNYIIYTIDGIEGLQGIIEYAVSAMTATLYELYIFKINTLGAFEEYGGSLLAILDEMKENILPVKDRAAIQFLETTIQDIPKEDSQLISIYELQSTVQDKLYYITQDKSLLKYYEEVITKILYELYSRLDKFEGSGTSLLEVLEGMKDMKKEILSDQDLAVIEFFEIKIGEIIKEDNHYITINELQNRTVAAQGSLDTEATIKILNKLYNELGKLETFGEGGDLILGASRHDTYKGDNTGKAVTIFHHTKGIERKASSENLRKGNSFTDEDSGEKEPEHEEKEKRRSFLRVWVTALPKNEVDSIIIEKD